MAQAVDAAVLAQQQADLFAAAVLRYLDGACSAEEMAEMREALAGSGPHREWFVNTCLLSGGLHESFAPRRAEWQAKKTTTAALIQAGAAPFGSSGARDRGQSSLRADDLQADPGAETVIHVSSPEDTVNPVPPSSHDQT